MPQPLLGTFSLRGRLTLYVTLVSVVPLLALTTLLAARSQRIVEEQIQGALQREAEGLKDLMEQTLVEREASARSWAEDRVLGTALKTGNAEESDVLLAMLQRRYTTLNGIVLFTDEGRAVAASTPALRDAYVGREAEVLQSAWFREAQQGRTTAEGVTKEDPIYGTRVLSLAVPVADPSSDKRLGVLLAAFHWGQVGAVVEPALERAHQRSLKSFALVVRQPDGTVLFDSRGADAHPDDASLLTVSVVNHSNVKDVGDGWNFVALVDPAEAYAPVAASRTLALTLVAAFAALAVAGSWLISRGITRPLVALSDAVGRIVRDGDLSQPFNVQAGKDEVGTLASSFGQLVQQLRDTAESLHRGTRVLSDTVTELHRAAEQQERNVARQAAALQETQVTAQEIKQTSLLAAEKAEAVLSVASRAEEVGREGETAIRDSLGGFQGLLDQSGQMAERIAQLNERTEQIGGITQTVKDLADQSNMLALNAAIEAVRSGEHGKGFSVVAREIRNLADQSIEATERVRDILGDLGSAILSTARMTEQSHAHVEAGLDQVRGSGDRLKELATIIQDNAAAVRQIAGAVSQQNAGIAQIFSAVTDLNTMMTDTQSSLKATTEAAKLLQDVATQMQGVARSYRI